MQICCQAKQSLQTSTRYAKPEKQAARLTNFNSKSCCPSLLLTKRIYLAGKPLLLQEEKKNQRQQHHRKRNFLSLFDFHSSALCAGLLTAETSRYESKSSALLPLPPNQLLLPLLLYCLPYPQQAISSTSSSITLPSPKESLSLPPKVLQILSLNFRAEALSCCREKDVNHNRGRKLKIPITNHHNYFIISLQHVI